MRIAKLEMKLVLAMLLVGYEYIVVDEHGKQTNELPKPNRNDALQVSILGISFIFFTVAYVLKQARPFGKPVYLKFKRLY